MEGKVICDWKFVLAIGVSVMGIILVSKLDPSDAREASIHAIDAGKELMHVGGYIQ